MTFEFTAPARIVFGEGKVAEAPAIAASLGACALVVRGGSAGAHARVEPLIAGLQARGLAVTTLNVDGEPTVTLAEEGAAVARAASCDVVVACGGGSVIDAAKAVASLLANPGSVYDYLETVGRGQPLIARSAPLVAIPTTAGTGAEVTRNAVLLAEDARVKASLRSPLMLPAVALIDPELTYSLPPAETASTGLDALTQCIEPFVTPLANPLTDAVAREGMRHAATALRAAVRDGSDRAARHDMAVASLCGGLALANAKLGAVHGFAAPLGGMFPVPHGVACARLLPPVAAANVRALQAAPPNDVAAARALGRYDEVAQLLTASPAATADDAGPWLAALVEELGVPRLGAYGVTPSEIDAIVAQARRASSMQGNPVTLSDDALADALGAAI